LVFKTLFLWFLKANGWILQDDWVLIEVLEETEGRSGGFANTGKK
jgi:hypothetical protein